MAQTEPESAAVKARIGVVIVAFNSSDVIVDCLESVFASVGAAPYVVVVDNNSLDDTVGVVERWASGAVPYAARPGSPFAVAPVAKPIAIASDRGAEARGKGAVLRLIRSPVNGGYGYACNLGLAELLSCADIDDFWILNPDCVVSPDAARHYLAAAQSGPYALLGSRTLYLEFPDRIQSDGGTFSRLTGGCRSIHNGQDARVTALPDSALLDYISGANMVASRAFVEQGGPMPEDYFLYFEEVDWAQRRGRLPLRLIGDALVYHVGGTAIGSGDFQRLPSPFSVYFNFRNRLRFVRRYRPASLPTAFVFNLLKVVQYLLRGAVPQAVAAIRASFALGPSPAIRCMVKDEAARRLAFPDWSGP